MMDLDEAKRILGTFEAECLEYVLVGSIAMAAQGLIRATRNMDIFVLPTPENVERLRRALRSLYAQDPHIEEIRSEDLACDYPALEYTPPHRLYSMDILSRLGNAF